MQLNEVGHHHDRAARWYDVGRAAVFDHVLGIERTRRELLERLGDLSGARVLDVGVGTSATCPGSCRVSGPRAACSAWTTPRACSGAPPPW